VTDISKKTIVRSLKKKGFKLKKGQGDHDWYIFYYKDKKYGQIKAKISRGSSYRTYPISLWTRMRKLLQLENNKQVSDLLTCPLDKDKYLEILKEKEVL